MAYYNQQENGESIMQKFSLGCTLDCFDCCKFNVMVDEQQKIKIEGDVDHPYTKGMICKKGRAHIERHAHSERLKKPLLKKAGKWEEITFEEAAMLMAEKLTYYKASFGSSSILYYEQYGSGSVLKSIGDIFFNFLGGVSKQKGGPCWSAGMAAQKLNFGEARSHALEDMMNSQTIIVWGKNPAYTTIHTMQMIQNAKKNGSYVIVIDPIHTQTARMADCYIPIQPGGDAALALAMGKVILEEGWIDQAYIENYVKGFEDYKQYLSTLKYETLCKRAGVSKEQVEELAKRYSQQAATILLGYGLQKYAHGGQTVSFIDTLGAITGQIGKKGGGVNYANKVFPGRLALDPYQSERRARNREFYVSHMSQFIKEHRIKMAVITKSNLLTQLADTRALQSALEKVDFKVCFEMFMTDTAKVCDLVLPATSILESEDLLFSSMTNPYLTYNEKIVEPEHPLMDEYAFYQAVAEKMNLCEYPMVSKREYLMKVLEPLRKDYPEVDLEYLKTHYFTVHQPVAWEDKKFLTPSGRFEIYLNPKFQLESIQSPKDYPLRLLTNHSKDTLFSQHFMDHTGRAKAYVHSEVANHLGLKDQEMVRMRSSQGQIEVCLEIDDHMARGTVMMYAGWWKKHGNPNELTMAGISDIGGQVTYHETFVRLEKMGLK